MLSSYGLSLLLLGGRSCKSITSPYGVSYLIVTMSRLETMEGKTVAIDSSIWIYQFQATMRDRDGRALVNAHLVGFLRRICKLLYYGMKPIFVFDGGAPVIKKATLVTPFIFLLYCWVLIEFIYYLERAEEKEERCSSQSCQSGRKNTRCAIAKRSSKPCSESVSPTYFKPKQYLTGNLVARKRLGKAINDRSTIPSLSTRSSLRTWNQALQ